MKKRIFCGLVVFLLSLALLAGCGSRSDEPCMYCGESPSQAYEKADGTFAYVCKDCSAVCMLCGREKATQHYESLLGMMFVCDDCYAAVTGY